MPGRITSALKIPLIMILNSSLRWLPSPLLYKAQCWIYICKPWHRLWHKYDRMDDFESLKKTYISNHIWTEIYHLILLNLIFRMIWLDFELKKNTHLYWAHKGRRSELPSTQDSLFLPYLVFLFGQFFGGQIAGFSKIIAINICAINFKQLWMKTPESAVRYLQSHCPSLWL